MPGKASARTQTTVMWHQITKQQVSRYQDSDVSPLCLQELILPLLLLGLLILISILNPHIYYEGIKTKEMESDISLKDVDVLGYTPPTNITTHIMEEVARELSKSGSCCGRLAGGSLHGGSDPLMFQTCRTVSMCLTPRRTWRTTAYTGRPASSVWCFWTAQPCLTVCAFPTTRCHSPVTSRSLSVSLPGREMKDLYCHSSYKQYNCTLNEYVYKTLSNKNLIFGVFNTL